MENLENINLAKKGSFDKESREIITKEVLSYPAIERAIDVAVHNITQKDVKSTSAERKYIEQFAAKTVDMVLDDRRINIDTENEQWKDDLVNTIEKNLDEKHNLQKYGIPEFIIPDMIKKFPYLKNSQDSDGIALSFSTRSTSFSRLSADSFGLLSALGLQSVSCT